MDVESSFLLISLDSYILIDVFDIDKLWVIENTTKVEFSTSQH